MVVQYSVVDGICRITLNRPERLNAVTPELVDRLCECLESAVKDRARAVVLAGEGTSFCAGHDLKQQPIQDEERRRQVVERTQDVTRLIRATPFPVIAAVHGYAMGAGCEFALCSDFVVAAESAIFGFPEVGVGLSITGGISHVLPLAVGMVRAKELVLLGERFSSTEALGLGLINRVVPDGELASCALEIAAKFAAQPAAALQYAKRCLDFGPEVGLEQAMHLESLYATMTQISAEARIAAEHFAETRRGHQASRVQPAASTSPES
ncbi:enoyl-CoA hydratase/isomerase family protein [Microbacterium kribbense]|uniref:Enoyl-CoA hydratase/isomerase family protein n=1 Tax=Microbacterium kribbense TaxID=433645 RepID=A0ABP7GY22_9MICO